MEKIEDLITSIRCLVRIRGYLRITYMGND